MGQCKSGCGGWATDLLCGGEVDGPGPVVGGGGDGAHVGQVRLQVSGHGTKHGLDESDRRERCEEEGRHQRRRRETRHEEEGASVVDARCGSCVPSQPPYSPPLLVIRLSTSVIGWPAND